MDTHWQACIDSFLQSIYDHSGSASSRDTYRSTLIRFFQRTGKALGEVTRSDVLSFIQSVSTSRRNFGQPASASTKNQRLCVLTSFYRYASTYEIDGEPLFQKAMPTVGMRYLKTDIAYRAMSTQELGRFFAAIPTDTLKGVRDRAIFATYFWTARRRNEIAHLCWKDIEPATIVERDGTRRQGHVYRYYAKGKSRQIKTKELPLPAWNAIRRYLLQAGRLATMQPDDPIFISTHPGQGRRGSAMNQPLHDDYICLLFKQYAAVAGLDTSRLSLHSLRHTAAHERQQAGQDILLIKELLDHERLETTYRYMLVMSGVADSGAKLLEARYGLLS